MIFRYRPLKYWKCWHRRHRQPVLLSVGPAATRERVFSTEAWNNMSWESPPIHRHLSTIGIGPVFVCPPPHPLPLWPQSDVEDDSLEVGSHEARNSPPPSMVSNTRNKNEYLTWEIVGNIKISPEDFIVREIGWAPTRIPTRVEQHTDQKFATDAEPDSTLVWSRQIAGLKCEYQSAAAIDGEGVAISPREDEKKEANYLALKSSHDKSARSPVEKVMKPDMYLKSRNEPDMESYTCSNHAEELQRILRNCFTNNTETTGNQGEHSSAAVLEKLAELQNTALDEIDSVSRAEIDGQGSANKSVWIPISQLDKVSRTVLHRAIRQVFPLLRTETSSACPSDDGNRNGPITTAEQQGDPNAKSWVCALIDRTFFSIIPSLANPRQDLLAFYTFRNRGPAAILSAAGNRIPKKGNHRNKASTEKWKPCKNEGLGAEPYGNENISSCSSNINSQEVVFLRLRHDLPKDKRRAIHQALSSSRRREFETSTVHDVPTNNACNDLTTAIVVQWSNQALKASKLKRKREDEEVIETTNISLSKPNPDITAYFCVLRKYQCEHQVAISNIARVLKCRASDVGLAGIKDMQAVTYQFCTLRNVDLKRIHSANRSLGNRIQILDMMEVHGSDSLLNCGKLIGSESTL